MDKTSDEYLKSKMQDDLRAQGYQYDKMVEDLAAFGGEDTYLEKLCRRAAHELRLRRPPFKLEEEKAADIASE